MNDPLAADATETSRSTLPRVALRAAAVMFGLIWLGMGSARAQSTTDSPLPSANALKQMSVEELMDLQVTSVSKRPEKLFDTASAIQVVTGDDIRRSGATSVPEALRLASNLEVAQIDSRQWAITARGFNNVFADKLLVLIDGRSVYTPLYAGVYWDVQNLVLDDVDRIEVISGPGATQWGANAVNGVINISTKSARDTQGALVVASGGTALTDSAEVRYGGQVAPGVYYRVYIKYFDRGSSVRPTGLDADDSWRLGQTGFRVDADTAHDSHLTFQGDIYDGTVTREGPDDIHVGGGNVLGRWSRTLPDNSDVSVQVYYDYTHRVIPQSFAQDLHTYDFDSQYHHPIGSTQNLLVGVGYRLVDDSIINTPANAFLPPTASLQNYNAFVQDEIALAEDVHLTGGSKVEHNDYTGFEVEPSLRLAWKPVRNQTVWSAVSRAVRTPSRIDRDLYSPATPPYRVAGGPDVVSEKLISYELGYRLQVDPRLSFAVATYYNDYTDLRSLEPLNPPAAFPVQISSGLRGRSAGAEFTADWHVTSGWKLHAGYTELRVTSEPQVGSIDRTTNRSISLDPNHKAQLRSFWDIHKNWEFDTTVRYVAPIGYQQVPGYVESDARLGWDIAPAWNLSVVGQNLLHNHHAEFNPPGSRREIERSVYAKTTWRF